MSRTAIRHNNRSSLSSSRLPARYYTMILLSGLKYCPTTVYWVMKMNIWYISTLVALTMLVKFMTSHPRFPAFFMYAPSQFSSYSLPLFPVISFPSASRLQVQLGGLGNTVSYPCERVSLLCVCSNLLAIVKFVVSIFWGTETCLVVTNIIFVRT